MRQARRYIAGRETRLVKSVRELLNRLGVPAWRNNTGVARETNADGSMRFVRYGVPGMPDVIGVIPPTGRYIGVECKVGDGELNKNQRIVLPDLRDAGALIFIVRDEVDESVVAAFRAAIDGERMKSRAQSA